MSIKRILLALAFVSASIPACVNGGGLPMAPVITYGLLRNEYGTPIDSGAVVSLVKADSPETICARHQVDGQLLVGVNYRLSLEMEDATPLQRTYAALVDEPMQVKVTIGGIEQPLTPTPFFNAPDSGTAQRIDFSIGVDSDGDGIPDAWKELMVIWSDGFFTSIDDIKADEDPDGDGMTNWEEYLAGTLPFLATDVLAITDFDRDPETGRLAIRFLSVDTRRYHIIVSQSLDEPIWSPAASSPTPYGELEYRIIEGTGRTIKVYVEGDLPSAFFRIAVN